ncbi:MAG: 3-deoxy-D-manno-octulosonic acid transferase [Planctomycetes bacterium]|nr:3-deoxy-D-manno-octulosonic acid transferase [Planctomycetota bacterium]
MAAERVTEAAGPVPEPIGKDPFPGFPNALIYGAYDLLWVVVALLLSPWWLAKAILRASFRRMVLERLTFGLQRFPAPTPGRSRVLVHGVSVGEIMASRSLVAALSDRCEVIVSTSTNTGFKVARQEFPHLSIVRFPLDPSPLIRRFLRRVQPEQVILLELEVWPNFLKWANRRGIPVGIVNGRITENSLRNYLRFSRSLPQFHRLSLFAVQDEAYATRFAHLVGTRERIVVTGNIKIDGIELGEVPESSAFETLKGMIAWHPSQTVLLAGSTHGDEDVWVHGAFAAAVPGARIILVPRHPERAGEVVDALASRGVRAQRLTGLRSGVEKADPARPLIVDTVGELGRIYGLATLVFVGGSLVPHGGQNMMEPAARGRAVIYGPHTGNFLQETALLEEGGGALRVQDVAELEAVVRDLIQDPKRRLAMARAGMDVALAQRGATERTVRALEERLGLAPA